METKPLPVVTVYITNHNYAKYLEQAIQSVLKQTFRNFELLIIDDGSVDNSREIIKRYEGVPGVYILFQENKGLNVTNNIALKLGQGKFIMRLDADDYLDPHALDIMVQEMERHPGHILVFPDYYLVDDNNDIIEHIRRHDFDGEVSLFDQPAHGACTLIRREALLQFGGYDEQFRCQDCYDVWLNVILAQAKYKKQMVSNINLPLFFYRQHEKSLTSKESFLLRTRAEIKAKHVKRMGNVPVKAIAVLPVRGTTMDPRSLPLATLGGKRLIDWSIEAALSSKYVSNVLVSTPDQNVKQHVLDHYSGEVLVVDRPRHMARINTSVEESLLDALTYYKSRGYDAPDFLSVVFIESPFRTGIHIDEGIDTMLLYDVDVVDGIRQEDSIFYVHNGQGLQPWKLNSGLRLERDNIYRRVGGIHIMRCDFLEKHKKMLDGRIGHIVLDQKAAFTIKSEMDWQIAKFLTKEEG